MIRRSYSQKYKESRPTYNNVSVCDEWLRFSKFKAWMETQDWEGKQLDKDLLVRGNKIYSPGTCVFVSRQVNMFLIEHGAGRGNWVIGVYWDTKASKFKACCCNPFTGKQEQLGYFNSEKEAHEAWLKRKLEHACNLGGLQTDERVAKALIQRYTDYNIEQNQNY